MSKATHKVTHKATHKATDTYATYITHIKHTLDAYTHTHTQKIQVLLCSVS